jgi:uncharacterized protein YaeQ
VALAGSPYRFRVQLSHVDRGAYEALDLKLSRHPSETERFLACRVLARCLWHEEGLDFSKGGLSDPDAPALSSYTLDGVRTLWIEIGTPSAERLHKATKACPRVAVVTHQDPALLRAALEGQRVHRLEQVEAVAFAPAFLDALAARFGPRGTALDVTVSDGQLYVTADGETLSCEITRVALV